MPDHRKKSLLRRLASSGAWSLIGRIGTMGSVLLNYWLICRVLPDDQVSKYVVCLGIVGFSSLVCGTGLGSVLLRRLSGTQASTFEQRRSLLLKILKIAAVSWLLVCAGFAVLLYNNPLFFNRPVASVGWILMLWVCARCTLSLVTEAVRGLQIFYLAALSGGQQEGPVVNLIMTVLLLSLGPFLSETRHILMLHVCVTTLISGIVLAMLLSAMKRIGDSDETPTQEIPFPSVGNLLSEGSKVLASQMAIFGIIELETILIGKYCDDIQVGAWGAIRRLMAIVSAPLLLINAAIPSFVAELHDKRDFKRMERLLRAASAVCVPPSLIAFVALYFFGGQLLSVFNPQFIVGWTPLALLAAANIVFVTAGSAGLTLRMTDNQGWATVSTLTLAVTYIIAAPWIISFYGITGAAVMAMALIVLRNLISTLLVRYVLKIWCIPSIDFAEMKRIVQMVRRRKSNRSSN